MKKTFYFKLLVYLAKYGVGVNVNIMPFLKKHFKTYSNDVTLSQRWTEITNLVYYVETNQHIGRVEYPSSFFEENAMVIVQLTYTGLEYLNAQSLIYKTVTNFTWNKWLTACALTISILSLCYTAYSQKDYEKRITRLELLLKSTPQITHTTSSNIPKAPLIR